MKRAVHSLLLTGLLATELTLTGWIGAIATATAPFQISLQLEQVVLTDAAMTDTSMTDADESVINTTATYTPPLVGQPHRTEGGGTR